MKLITAFLLFSLLITPSCRAEDKKVKSVDGILNIQEVTTKSGITAWLVEDNSLPIISLKFSFRGAGSINDTADKQGLVQLLSNTMDEGAGDLTSQEFQKILSDNSISLYFNSGRDNFGGQLKNLTRNQDKAFELLKLALTKPRFDEAPIERMRASNMARIKSSMGDPKWIAARIYNDKVFEGHPYALNSGGTLTSLLKITPNDLRNHHQQYLTKDRLVIGVMGNISAEELKPILENTFGELPTAKNKEVHKIADVANQGRVYLFKKDIPQTIIKIFHPSFDNTDPDYPALQVLNYIYGGGGFGSRLMEEAREKRGLTYGIYSQLYSLDHANTLSISTSTKNESVIEMLDIIKNELTEISRNPVSEEELKNAKDYIVGSLPLSLTSTDKISSILLSLQLNDRPITYLDKFVEKINVLTVEDITRVSSMLYENKFTTIMVGNPENLTDKVTIEELPNVE